ncbi:MAG: serine hydrolase [Xenococcaceae cyanobacterium MO_188.B32]|nr:serine hydrolase [Xenococcaceae cyanobacterium MO_188.B32]
MNKSLNGQPTKINNYNAAPTKIKHRRAKKRKKNLFYNLKPFSFIILFWIRLLIIVVGVSTILGTSLSIINSSSNYLTEENIQNPEKIQEEQPLENFFLSVSLGEKISALENKINDLAARYSQLQPGVFLVDLDNNGYVSIEGRSSFSSASTIKVPILVALFQDIDKGKISLDETLVMSEDLIAGGSGNMQYEEPGKQFSVLETATKMIVISDNTATNMFIKRLGGADALNQRFLEWGLTATAINNPLPDLTGTNTTSPEDLGNLLIAIEKGKLISLRSRDRLLKIMRGTRTNTLLPEGLEKNATIAHKTGDIRSVLGDVGIVDMPSGKRYVASVLVKRPDNDPKAKELIQKISGIAYQHFKWSKS